MNQFVPIRENSWTIYPDRVAAERERAGQRDAAAVAASVHTAAVVARKTIQAPLPHVSVHVVESPRVWRILADYRADIRKYAEGLDPVRIQAVFDSVPVQLAKENRKFQWTTVSKGATRKDYWGCVEWLEDAGVVCKCRRMDVPELPIGAHLDNDAFKLYMCDSGLLLAMLEKEAQEDVRIRRDLGTWKGGLFEHIVGEALVKAGMPLAYFKRDNSTLEMDFFARSADRLVPIEVKAGNNRSKSLRTLIDRETYKDNRWGIKLAHGNVGFENGILTLPQWCAFRLPEIVRDFCPGMGRNRG